jgi:hypothetical protein
MPKKMTTASWKYMRNPHACIEIVAYSGSQWRGDHAVIMDDLSEDFDPQLFLHQVCTGTPPAQMTLRDVLNDYPDPTDVTTAAIFCTTEVGEPPEAVVWVEYNSQTGQYNVLENVPRE